MHMRKSLFFITAMLVSIVTGFSQASFNTGDFEVDINVYGRVRLYDGEGTRHLQRASILVGVSETAVFDYNNDAEELEPPVLVSDPVLSDFEIYGAFDNSYSGLPPFVTVKLNAYGWVDGDYTILRFKVINDEEATMTALIGLDIIPELNGEYGFDTVTYHTAAGAVRFHRGTQMNMGIKLLQEPLASLYSFEWYDGYTVDSDYWTWMNYGSLQPEYVSTTADGPVSITSQPSVSINPGDSVEVFYALALGADEATMLANIAAAKEKYTAWFTGLDEKSITLNAAALGQNYPNPFTGNTTISYRLPEQGPVSLKVYNSIGQEVAVLVDAEQNEGIHTVQFNAEGLTGGMYYCTLLFDGQAQSRKMFLK